MANPSLLSSIGNSNGILPFNAIFRLNTSSSTLTTAYQNLAITGTGVITTNTITASGTVTSACQVGNKIRIGGTDIYTIATLSGVTITTVETLSANYTAGSALALNDISIITDISGYGNNGAQSTPADQPSLVPSIINGNSAMGFNGTVSRIAITTSSTMDNIFATGGTQAFVLKPRTAGGSGNARLWDKTNNVMIVSGLSGGKFNAVFQQNATSNWQWSTTATTIPQNAASVLIITYNASTPGTAPNIYVNSTSSTALTTTLTGSGTATSDAGIDYGLGNRAGLDRGFDGLIAEAMAWKRVLTSTEISQVTSYANSQYNITIS